MAEPIRASVFSPNDPRPWVRSENLELMLEHERLLIQAPRGRTPGGHTMTVARLGRENLRYQLVATVIETVDVDPSEHRTYNPSWPIIKGRIPVPDRVLMDVWPCNHLGFAFGDWTAEPAETAHRLDIGYRIFDATGREYYKAT